MASRSSQACLACKKSKRQCDKLLPDCSLCRRTNRACDYNAEPGPAPTAEEWSSLRARLTALESRFSQDELALSQGSFGTAASSEPSSASSTLHQSAPRSELGLTAARTIKEIENIDNDDDFPASMFLDTDRYIWSKARPPAPRRTIPPSILTILGQENIIIDVSKAYFDTIHKWLPMVSKKRLDMGLPLQNAGPDLAMLFLAMKLITKPITPVPDLTLYREAKAFLALLEGDGVISLLLLQAMILIAVYELGHAIYPAAWMTTGSCARYSDVLGIGPGDFTVLEQVTTWTEAEERKRVWWCVFILDKIIALGSKRRCAVPEPLDGFTLPVDDEHWDQGDVRKALGFPTNTPYKTQQSGFTRLCQAALYLNRAIGLARVASPSSHIPEVMALVHELDGFASVVDSEHSDWRLEISSSLLAPRAIIRSALFTVLDRFSCPEKMGSEPGYIPHQGTKSQQELELQSRAILLMEGASRELHSIVMSILPLIPVEEGFAADSVQSLLSPFIMDSVYSAAATLYWLFGETGDQLNQVAAADMEMFLDGLGHTGRNMSWAA
ncbi:hypothetical protein HG530_012623 [Fusarium avenaceum]|nr:hypothetical protein HG530_012623 [Fusarium avenaceum]